MPPCITDFFFLNNHLQRQMIKMASAKTIPIVTPHSIAYAVAGILNPKRSARSHGLTLQTPQIPAESVPGVFAI
jgi:hypothetical protein